MVEMSSMGIGSKPCLDIRPSSDQINDRSISFSQLGKGKKEIMSWSRIFFFTFRILRSSEIPQLIRRHLTRHEVITSTQFHYFSELIGVVGRLVGVVGVQQDIQRA